jgi:hypothetical protein
MDTKQELQLLRLVNLDDLLIVAIDQQVKMYNDQRNAPSF